MSDTPEKIVADAASSGGANTVSLEEDNEVEAELKACVARIQALINAAREEGSKTEREAIAEELQVEGWVTAAKIVRNK